MYLEYCDDIEYGGPQFDPKRPFGNSDRWAILRDMANIFGIDEDKVNEDSDSYDEALVEHLEYTYRGTADALKIILDTKSFTPGTYAYDWNTRKWISVTKERVFK